MHATQIAYMHAAAAHKAIEQDYHQQHERAFIALEAGWITDAQYEAWIDPLAMEMFNSMDRLVEAENAMIDWSLEMVSPLVASAEARDALDVLIANRHKPAIRRKLAALAFKLDDGTPRKTTRRSRRTNTHAA